MISIWIAAFLIIFAAFVAVIGTTLVRWRTAPWFDTAAEALAFVRSLSEGEFDRLKQAMFERDIDELIIPEPAMPSLDELAGPTVMLPPPMPRVWSAPPPAEPHYLRVTDPVYATHSNGKVKS